MKTRTLLDLFNLILSNNTILQCEKEALQYLSDCHMAYLIAPILSCSSSAPPKKAPHLKLKPKVPRYIFLTQAPIPYKQITTIQHHHHHHS